MKYVKKPVVIEAWRNYTGDPVIDGRPNMATPSPAWLNDTLFNGGDIQRQSDGSFIIHTLEGAMRCGSGDWVIRGIKGELYPCKDDIFRATYSAVGSDVGGVNLAASFDFGLALHALKSGKRVRRSGWNGKGMWLALTDGLTLETEQMGSLRGAAVLAVDEQMQNTTAPRLTIGAHIDMRAADGSLVIGWLASQTDMLATDWEIVE